MIKKLWNQVANATIHRNHVRPEVVQRCGDPEWLSMAAAGAFAARDYRDLALALAIRDRVVQANPTVFGGG